MEASRKSDLLEQKKDLIARTNQLINGHRNAQASGRSISLGNNPISEPFKKPSREVSPAIVRIPPSPVMKHRSDNNGNGVGGGSVDNSKLLKHSKMCILF